MSDKNLQFTDVALSFAQHLAAGKYQEARALLVEELQEEWSEKALEEEYTDMIDYEGAPQIIEVVNTLEDWAAKEKEDLGWAYVAISGQSWAEAVAVVVCKEGSRKAIREIEWGRP